MVETSSRHTQTAATDNPCSSAPPPPRPPYACSADIGDSSSPTGFSGLVRLRVFSEEDLTGGSKKKLCHTKVRRRQIGAKKKFIGINSMSVKSGCVAVREEIWAFEGCEHRHDLGVGRRWERGEQMILSR
jgi:hypothetical protein